MSFAAGSPFITASQRDCIMQPRVARNENATLVFLRDVSTVFPKRIRAKRGATDAERRRGETVGEHQKVSTGLFATLRLCRPFPSASFRLNNRQLGAQSWSGIIVAAKLRLMAGSANLEAVPSAHGDCRSRAELLSRRTPCETGWLPPA